MNLDNLYEQKINTYGYGKKEDNESISSYLLKLLRPLDFELQESYECVDLKPWEPIRKI
ncbi:hypothetical protein J7889_04485 [Mycoplasmopsis agalactiae]|nr:hypothetical protein [Mycoplasmopsis agalactiae]MCE6056796.1 hypothetical protein [Mycoplasmopsis agalactiae]